MNFCKNPAIGRYREMMGARTVQSDVLGPGVVDAESQTIPYLVANPKFDGYANVWRVREGGSKWHISPL